MSKSAIHINIDRVLSRIHRLGNIGSLAGGGVCRLALSDEDAEARNLLMDWLQEAGADVRIDRMGNIFGIRRGREDLAAVMSGSHLDTVKTGGLYDGSLGVVAAVEIMELLQEQQIETARPFAVVNFTNEEGVRFAPGMTGSKAMANPSDIDRLLGIEAAEEDTTLAKELKRTGFDGEQECGFVDIDRFIELHIEQGPVLEREKIPVGVVEAVQGIYWTEYVISGESGHAGTTPMDMRKDAGHAAACMVNYLRKLTDEIGGVATAGFQEIKPNATNVIPEKARLRIDFRHPDASLLAKGQDMLDLQMEKCCRDEGVSFKRSPLIRQQPVKLDGDTRRSIEMASDELGYAHKKMNSGAGHDAQALAAVCPSAMIFIPCRDGISHNVNEYAEPEGIKKGANILLHTVLKWLNREKQC